MGLETATFVSGLTAAWPLSSDKKNQGDDHLRLIKSVLQGTFPNASKAFYFPSVNVMSSTISLGTILSSQQNQCIMVDTNNGADSTITLPTLIAGDAGWWVEIMKTSSDAFGVLVSPASGTITSKVGATNTVRVGIRCEPARFRWSGTTWFCSKAGPMIGSTEHFNGSTLPPGYLYEDGSSYNNTLYAELFAVLGSSVLKDKRGRTDIGDGTGSGLTNRVLGTNYGAETQALSTTHLPPYTPSGSVQINSLDLSVTMRGGSAGTIITTEFAGGGSSNGSFGPGLGAITLTGQNISFTGNAQGGNSTAFGLLQPSVASKKIIRAC